MRLAALQSAAYARLNDTSVTSLLSGAYSVPAIFTEVPQPSDAGAAGLFPYITYHISSVTPFDTDDQAGGNAVVQVDIWSRNASDAQVNGIADAVDARLRRQPMTITGSDHITTELISATMTEDPDGKTKRMLMLYRVTYLG